MGKAKQTRVVICFEKRRVKAWPFRSQKLRRGRLSHQQCQDFRNSNKILDII